MKQNDIDISLSLDQLAQASKGEKEDIIRALEDTEDTSTLRHVRMQLSLIRTQLRQSIETKSRSLLGKTFLSIRYHDSLTDSSQHIVHDQQDLIF